MLSGAFVALAVIKHGADRFRRQEINADSADTIRIRRRLDVDSGFDGLKPAIRVEAPLVSVAPCDVDPGKMGYASEALVGVQADPDKIDQVAEDLAQLDEVDWVTITTGAYDIFAWAALQSVEALGIFLRTKVGSIPGVRRTETFVNLSVKKRGYGISV